MVPAVPVDMLARLEEVAVPHRLMVTVRLLAGPGAVLWLLQSLDANSAVMAVQSCTLVSTYLSF